MARLSRDDRSTGINALQSHGLRFHFASTQRGIAGRICGSISDQAVSRITWRHASQRLPNPKQRDGTNPASAQMANMQVVVVKCDDAGNIDLVDLDAKIAANTGRVAAIMIYLPRPMASLKQE